MAVFICHVEFDGVRGRCWSLNARSARVGFICLWVRFAGFCRQVDVDATSQDKYLACGRYCTSGGPTARNRQGNSTSTACLIRVDTARLHKGSFAPIGSGTVRVETVKVIRPIHVSGLSRINVLQCRKRCTGKQKWSPFCPFRGPIRKSASFSLCRGGRDVRHPDHQKQKQ